MDPVLQTSDVTSPCTGIPRGISGTGQVREPGGFRQKLGAHDALAYDPKNMTTFTWPSAQPEHRIDAPISGSLEYKTKIKGTEITMTESAMGRQEQIYLAPYDQDPVLQKRDGSVFMKVLGGDRYVPYLICRGLTLTVVQPFIGHQVHRRTT